MPWRKDGSLLRLNGNRETFLVQDDTKPTLFIGAYCSEPADVVWYEQCIAQILTALQARENVVTCGRGHKIPSEVLWLQNAEESRESFNSIRPRKIVWLAIAELFNEKFTPNMIDIFLDDYAFELWQQVMLKVRNLNVTKGDFEDLTKHQIRGWHYIARVSG